MPEEIEQLNYRQCVKKFPKFIFKLGAFALYNIFVCWAVVLDWNDNSKSTKIKTLMFLTLLVYTSAIYHYFARDVFLRPCFRKLSIWIITQSHERRRTVIYRVIRRIFWPTIFLALGTFIYLDSKEDRIRLVSFGGLLVLLFFGYAFSKHRKKVVWRPVLSGVFVQYLLAFLLVRWPIGHALMMETEKLVVSFVSQSKVGSMAVYGFLASEVQPPRLDLSIVAYKILTVFIVISMWTSVLYYMGAMQRIMRTLGWLLEKIMGTTACESMVTAASVMLNMPEACLTIKPYLEVMTLSEMHATITAGFSTITVIFFAVYVKLGIHASHLITASLMSAPASLAFSKLVYPETETSRTHHWNVHFHKSASRSIVEAAVTGACEGIALMLRVICFLVAFISFITFCNCLPGWLGGMVDLPYISLQWFFGKLFLPVAYLMGVKWSECGNVAWLIGINACFANFAGYKIMEEMKRAHFLSPRSEMIATYAVCGFCNLSTVGVALESLGSLVPRRKSEIAAMISRAMITGTCACFMTACIAGSMVPNDLLPESVYNETLATFDTDQLWNEAFI